jgi:hypothetical protein
MDFIIARGAAFRAQLTPDDIVGLYTAKWLFHASSLVPFLLYHAARLPDLRPRFPCTISWTVRVFTVVGHRVRAPRGTRRRHRRSVTFMAHP